MLIWGGVRAYNKNKPVTLQRISILFPFIFKLC